jgi:hypothetical protein
MAGFDLATRKLRFPQVDARTLYTSTGHFFRVFFSLDRSCGNGPHLYVYTYVCKGVTLSRWLLSRKTQFSANKQRSAKIRCRQNIDFFRAKNRQTDFFSKSSPSILCFFPCSAFVPRWLQILQISGGCFEVTFLRRPMASKSSVLVDFDSFLSFFGIYLCSLDDAFK